MSLSEQEYKDYIAALVDKARTAQKEFEKNYTNQRAIDEVVRIIGLAPVKAAQKICEDILSETGMGDLQSKLMKLNVVALNQWNQMKGLKSVGIFDCPDEPGVCYIPKPLGVIGCIMPSTNPIVTIISNGMAAIKCRNAVIVAPHPASAFVSQMAVDMIREDLAKIGAPQDIIQTISPEMASIAATNELLHQCDVNVATGGRAMVKAVYSSAGPPSAWDRATARPSLIRMWRITARWQDPSSLTAHGIRVSPALGNKQSMCRKTVWMIS